MVKCPLCDYEHDNLVSLSLHYRKRHKGTARQLCTDLSYGGIEPTCACGCGEVVRFLNVKDGFSTYKRGHVARVHNNWGHNPTALERSHATTKQRYAAGEIDVWNKGLSKETDERVAILGRSGSATFMADVEERARRSQQMRESRLDGTIPTLSGSAHSGWKGGVSSVQALARSYVFNVWTYPKLFASGFTCKGCGATRGLEVHHDGERFTEILQKARNVLGDVSDDFTSHQAYARWVADYHVEHDVSGVVLCERCHGLAHAGERGRRVA